MNNRLPKYLMTLLIALCSTASFSQQMMLQGWWWNYPVNIGIHRFGANYLSYLNDFKEAGFDYIWLPPLSRSSTNQASVGYDIMDYYDLGEYGLGATRFGTRRDVNNLMDSMHRMGLQPVADMVYNQRVGGAWENNIAVQGWITNMNDTKITNGDQPYPSDRFRCYFLIGGNSGNGPGTYYFKFRSASLDSRFYGFRYNVNIWTGKTPLATDSTYNSWEFEPNGGGACGDSDNYFILGYTKYASVDAGGCGIDEFRVTLDSTMYRASGDTVYITMNNADATTLGGFADQYLYDLWSGPLNASIASQVTYQTATDFTHLPSGKGPMTWANFKPNGNATQLSGDWDEMLFFYDIDQYVASTQKTISDYQDFMFDTIGIQGMRMDAVKNYTYNFSAQMLDSLYFHHHQANMLVGEFYDYNPSNLTGFIGNVEANMNQQDTLHMRVFDFAMRGALQAACDQFGYDVRNIFTSGMVDGASGHTINAVPFVNNHDFRAPGQAVTNNPELAYAYIIMNQKLGVPCVYLGDYFANNFIRGRIKGAMHASKKYVTGFDEIDYLSAINTSYGQTFINNQFQSTTIIFQIHNPVTNRVAFGALNFAGDTLNVYQKVNTSFIAAGDTFTDILGVGPTVTTNITGNNELHVVLPPRSFTLYVQGGDLQDSLLSLGDTIAPAHPTAINETAPVKNEMSVYPNPFKQSFNLELGNDISGVMSLEVYDLSGRKLFSERMMSPGSGAISVNPQLTVSGIYILKVTANDESQFFKLARN